MKTMLLLAGLAALQVGAQAQWLNYPAPGTPRTHDGKPNLAGPAPRARGGKPDLSGIWEAQASPIPELMALLPGGGNGLGEDIPNKYFIDILADFKPAEEPLRSRPTVPFSVTSFRKDDPGINCLPSGMPMLITVPAPFKIVQTPGLIMMLSEGDNTFRQVFTDGRKHPVDPQPSWLGYSVGHWDGDTMVVETLGLNDRGWLDASGHKHSEALRLTERYSRRDFGHMDVQLTLDDPKTFTKPVTVKFTEKLLPDTDLIESFCSENEADRVHAGFK
jgi:hypothetical protein